MLKSAEFATIAFNMQQELKFKRLKGIETQQIRCSGNVALVQQDK